ncbi:uncharacterized protein Z518_00614 [Rhinocladiella mackenziei CBS 650.93]|uniref:Swi5-domain-containing protein n=1 Tax=Rhinocladiella mackenziei CBS 650.93 TaxID=1442369 RepID=A0A0D2ITZ3_9EURO|nr:uncharacterized protein Z518_00614 [Rhinocladiella mackenziei CBS 650.93]KIX09534.1 hypothetical protein Z518_00614 [Rhinocladiella mackenziei CBS 650.93]
MYCAPQRDASTEPKETERTQLPAETSSPPPPTKSETPAPSPSLKNLSYSKLINSIQLLESKVISTEDQLATTLQEISRLKSFPPQAQESEQLRDESQPRSSTAKSASSINKNEAALQHAENIFTRHIALLKEYNEIKDIAMGMLSLIADKEDRRLVEVMEERGVSEKD